MDTMVACVFLYRAQQKCNIQAMKTGKAWKAWEYAALLVSGDKAQQFQQLESYASNYKAANPDSYVLFEPVLDADADIPPPNSRKFERMFISNPAVSWKAWIVLVGL